MADSIVQPGQVQVLNPTGDLGSIPEADLQSALAQGYRQATPQDVSSFQLQKKYGTPGQQALTAVEGVAKGLAGPLATGAETALGVDPEAIRGREEANPTTAGVSEVAGFLGPAIASGGATMLGKAGVVGAAKVAPLLAKAAQFTEAGLLSGAGHAAEKAAGSFIINQTAKDVVRGAFESALFQGGEELSKKFKEDPNQTAETAIANLGLASVLGGVFGGATGALMRKAGIKSAEEALVNPTQGFVSEADRPLLEAGDLATSIKYAEGMKPAEKEGILDSFLTKSGLNKEKANAGEIRGAAERLGAPALEGMISDSKWIQRAEDSLINGAPTYSGLKRRALYDSAYKTVEGAVDGVLGEGSKLTKAELGNQLKSSIASKLEAQNAPIKALYDQLKADHQTILLPKNAGKDISAALRELQEFKLGSGTPQGRMVKEVLGGLKKLQTVDDVKAYKTLLNQSLSPTSSPGEKRVMSIIGDMLSNLEESSVETFAKNSAKVGAPEYAARTMALLDQRKLANKGYKELIEKVKTLSEQLGKGRVHGLQDALHFINEKLTPEEVTGRLFSKNNSEFLKFFSKEFPEEAALMRDYQKGALREGAMREDKLSPRTLFTKLNKLEPEIKASLFSKEELAKLGDAETYLTAFPKNFNPSGTAGAMDMRDYFSPSKAATQNLRDLAVEKFIKGVGASPETANAVALAKATVQGDKAATKAIRSLLKPGSEMPDHVIPMAAHRQKLIRLVADYEASPDKMLGMNDSNPVDEYQAPFAATTARAVSYLASVKPDTTPKSPLDPVLPPDPFKQADYERALDLAQQPLMVMALMKKGTLRPTDIQTIRAIYPSMYQGLVTKMMSEVVDAKTKGQDIPYQTRMQMSMFMGQPLDSTMTPMAILAAQPKGRQPQGGMTPIETAKKDTKGLSKMVGLSQTEGQSRQKSRAMGNHR